MLKTRHEKGRRAEIPIFAGLCIGLILSVDSSHKQQVSKLALNVGCGKGSSWEMFICIAFRVECCLKWKWYGLFTIDLLRVFPKLVFVTIEILLYFKCR